MARDVISAKLDIIFKKMFSTEENEDMLHDFLASLLEIPYNSIQKIDVLNSEVLPETAEGKFSRMDLKLLVDDRIINVEMQISSESGFRDRVLYYWSKMYSDELRSGDKYSELRQTISISIVNFKMFECDDFHSHFKVLETNRHEALTDKCSIHFFELKKINKKINKNNRMELWLQLINAESEEELEMLQETNIPVIQKAVMVIHKMSADEKMQEIARLREKALHDEASALGEAREEGMAAGIKKGRKEGIKAGMKKGRAEGRAEGIAEERTKITAKLKASGMTEEQIRKLLQ